MLDFHLRFAGGTGGGGGVAARRSWGVGLSIMLIFARTGVDHAVLVEDASRYTSAEDGWREAMKDTAREGHGSEEGHGTPFPMGLALCTLRSAWVLVAMVSQCVAALLVQHAGDTLA